MSRLVLGAALILVWVLMWGSAAPANLLSGLIVVVVLFAADPTPRPWLPGRPVRPIPLLVLVGRFVVDVVRSNVLVTYAVLGPSSAVHRKLVRVDLRVDDPTLLTLVTNMTALTPGAMVVGYEHEDGHPVVFVHVLTPLDPDRQVEAMQGLEGRCVRTFGTAEQLRAYDRAIAGDGTVGA
jgi:multicomponent Na+:H+ antiporter subunit E